MTMAEKIEIVAQKMFERYIDNAMGYLERRAVPDYKYGSMADPDELLMRGIEENCDIPMQAADDFRRSIVAFVGHLSAQGQYIGWMSNPQIKKGIECYIAESQPELMKEIRNSLRVHVPKYRSMTDPWEPAW